MKDTLIKCRLAIQTMQVGLIRLLLTLSLATAGLPAFSASNIAPVISGTPPTSVVAGSSYFFQPSATDANRDRLRFTISNKPAWASFSSRRGQLSGTPGSTSVGTYSNIVISVSDRRASVSLPAFNIRVDAATNGGGDGVTTSSVTSPTSSVSASSATTSGSRWRGRRTRSGNTATSGGTTSGGTTSGTTTIGDTSGTSTSSGSTTGESATGSGMTAPVTNSAPVIGGTPGTSVVAGSAYSFQPTATDADTDPLSFSISGKPSWASFSSTTGRLSGTPATSGTYSNIVIRVSDGTDSASLPAFIIQVQAAPVQTGSLTLQWTAPVTRADGTPLSLSDIDGYHIYYGVSAGNYPNRIDVANGTAQAATITDMPAGPYYLVMTTYDVSGLESAYSSMVTKYAQ
ncbi:MAG: putative Ig domain-containing protein [Gammaproteobacteria bacterium]